MRFGISVVIPYAGSRTFTEMLESLVRQTLDRRYFEIIVATELSTTTPDLVKKLTEARAVVVHWKRPEDFKGHSAGILRNFGVSKSRHDILLFADSDAILAPDCLAEHLRLHRSFPGNVICGGWHELPIHAQRVPFNKSTHFEALFDKTLFDYRVRAKRPRHWENVYSGNMSISKGLFMTVGGFDDLGHRCHDMDLGYRLYRAGAKFRFSPECRAVHVEHPRSILSRVEQAKGWLHLADKFPDVRPRAEERALMLMRSYRRTVNQCERVFGSLTARMPGIRAGNRWIVPAQYPEKDVHDTIGDYPYISQKAADSVTHIIRLDRNCWDYAIVHPHSKVLDGPQVSILLTAFNSERVVGRAINSVLEQSFQSFELLAIDDASSDSSEEILRSFAVDGRIRVFVNSETRGLARSLNRGLEAVRAPIVLQLDADDWLEPDALETIFGHFQNNAAIGGVYARAYIHAFDKVYEADGYQAESEVDFLSYKTVQAPRAYRTEILRSLGGWSIQDVFDGRFFEDRPMLARVRSVAPVKFINRLLYHVERSPYSLTRRNPRKTATAKLLILYAEANKRRMQLDAKWNRSGVVSRLVTHLIRAPQHAWSIIIVSHERANLIKYSLRSWLESDATSGAHIEIVVVDDGSSQPLSEIANTDSEKIRFIRLADRRGPAHARHVGVKNAKNPMIFFADGDHIVPPDVLGSHERRHSLCAAPSVIVGGLFGRKAATSVDPVGIPVQLFRKLLEQTRFDRQRLLQLAEASIFGGIAELLKENDQRPIWESVEPLSFADPYLAGWLPDALTNGDVANGPFGFMRLRTGTLSMSMETYRKIGGFDPAIAAIEDWELGFRCQMLGIPIVSAPEIEAYHQLHPPDSLRAPRTHSALGYFQRKHGKAFDSLFSEGEVTNVPGLSVIRRRAGGLNGASSRIKKVDRKRPLVVLTFDDGLHPVSTSHFLELLHSAKVSATFFVMGSNVVRYRGIVRAIVEAGCEIGIHGWDYTPVIEQTPAEIAGDLKRAVATIFDAVGVLPRFCRPPYGRASAGYLNAAVKLGLSSVGWHVSPCNGKSPSFTEVIVELATKQLLGKTISLPDGAADPEVTIQVLDWLLGCARRNNVAVLSAVEAQTQVTFPTPTVVNFTI